MFAKSVPLEGLCVVCRFSLIVHREGQREKKKGKKVQPVSLHCPSQRDLVTPKQLTPEDV